MDAGTTTLRYPVNRLAAALPEMSDSDFQAFKDDIRENGQRDPISILDGEIVDGRHRDRALWELGIAPFYEILPTDTDPLKFILSKHRHRRNMSTSQSAIASARIYLLSLEGSQQDSDEGETKDSESAILQIAPLTQAEAAALFGVKMRTFSDAVRVLTSECAESLVRAADQGHIAVSDAKRVIDQPHDVQNAAAKMVLEGAARTVRAAVNRILKEESNRVENQESTGESWRSSSGRAVLHNCGIPSLIPLVEKGSVDTIIGHVPQGEDADKTLGGTARLRGPRPARGRVGAIALPQHGPASGVQTPAREGNPVPLRARLSSRHSHPSVGWKSRDNA